MNTKANGYTLVEILVSGALLAAVLLGGLALSSRILSSTQTASHEGNVEAQGRRIILELQQLLKNAGRSTLSGLPQGGEVSEPLQDGTDYDNLEFRQAQEFDGFDVIYSSGVGDPPLSLSLLPDLGQVVLDDGATSRVLARNVTQLRFRIEGRRLFITVGLQSASLVGTAERLMTGSIALKAP